MHLHTFLNYLHAIPTTKLLYTLTNKLPQTLTNKLPQTLTNKLQTNMLPNKQAPKQASNKHAPKQTNSQQASNKHAPKQTNSQTSFKQTCSQTNKLPNKLQTNKLPNKQTPKQTNSSVYRVELWKNEVSYTALTMTQWLEVGFPASVHDLPAILAQRNKSKYFNTTHDNKYTIYLPYSHSATKVSI